MCSINKNLYRIGLILHIALVAMPCVAQPDLIDSLKQKIRSTPSTAQFDILSKITLEYLKVNLDSALVYSEKAFQLAKTLGADSLIAKAAYRNSEVLLRKNQLNQSIKSAEIALDKFTSTWDTIGSVKALNIIGGIWLNRVNYTEAMKYFYQSLKLADKIGDKRSWAAITTNLSFIEKQNGNREKAISMLKEAQAIVTGLGDNHLLMTILNSLANLYDELKDCQKSLETRLALIKLAQAQKDNRMEAIATSNLVISYKCGNQYDKIPEICDRAILLKQDVYKRQWQDRLNAGKM